MADPLLPGRRGAGTLGVIGGSGMETAFDVVAELGVETSFGPRTLFTCRTPAGVEFSFLPRHGADHSAPPHAVNHRANVTAMKRLGASLVITTSAVGSMNGSFAPGMLGLVDQFLDFSRQRHTLFETEPVHTDMTNPYDRELQGAIGYAARSLGIELSTGLTYVSVEGPRYETAAEIRMFRTLGGDVVGMTGAPEAILAREAGIGLACIVLATNWAAGTEGARAFLTHGEVVRAAEEKRSVLVSLIEGALDRASSTMGTR